MFRIDRPRAACLQSARTQRVMTRQAPIAAEVTAAIRQSEAVANRVLAILVATDQVQKSVDVFVKLPATLDRLAEAAGEIIEGILPDVLHDEQDLANIRRFLLQPQDTYSIDELALVWRITRDEVSAIYHDELLAHPGEPESLRIAWRNAVVTTVAFHLFRPFDIEVALGADFGRALSESWRTMPVLIRLPRAVVDAIENEPRIADRNDLAAHIEQFILQLFEEQHRAVLLGRSLAEEPG